MALIQQDLGRDVLWGAADRESTLGDDLSESEINHLQVAVVGNHDVLRLQVSVDDVLAVQVLKDTHNLCPVELSLLEVEMLDRTMVGEEVATSQQLSHEIDVAVILQKAIVVHL